MESSELVTVYTLADPVKAEIIKNALEDEGIRCFLDGANQAGEIGLMVFEIKVQVPAADAERARRFIEAHESMPDDAVSDDDDEDEEGIVASSG
jgi:hypothetical protein